MKVDIKLTGRAILCEFPTGEKLLMGEIDIDCPDCGAGTWRIHGHHMRSVLRILAEWIEQYPELVGTGNLVEVARYKIGGTAPVDPGVN